MINNNKRICKKIIHPEIVRLIVVASNNYNFESRRLDWPDYFSDVQFHRRLVQVMR